MLRAAFRSACAVWPQDRQTKRAWLSRDSAAVYPQAWHPCDLYAALTLPTRPGAFCPSRVTSTPQPFARMARFRPAFCRTFVPGASTVPLAERVMLRTRRSSTRIRSKRRADARKDWVEKLSTDLARRFDLIRVEDLRVRNMTRSAKGTVDAPGTNGRPKAGLNRAILDQGWGVLVTRLEQKAPGRVEQVNAAYTSQRCHACGYTAAEPRERQARFGCRSCGNSAHADLSAARNIAAGHAGTAPGGPAVAGPVNREPQHASLRVA